MGKYRSLDMYADVVGAGRTPPEEVEPESAPSSLENRLRMRMLRNRWKKEKGRDWTQGEESLVANGGAGAGPEDLRQYRDLLEWMGASGGDIDQAIKESGSYKLEKPSEEALADTSVAGDVGRYAKETLAPLARPFRELGKGNVLGAVKEAAILPVASLTGGVVGGSERDAFKKTRSDLIDGALNVLGAGQEGAIAGAYNLLPTDESGGIKAAGKAFYDAAKKKYWKGGEEQQEKIDKAFEDQGIQFKTPLGRASRVTGFFLDPLNLPTGGMGAKGAKLLGFRSVADDLAKSAGKGLAKIAGTQEEKLAALLDPAVAKSVYDDIVQSQVKRAVAGDAWSADVAKAFTKEKVWDVIQKIPGIGESGAAAISRTLRALPLIGKKFGVAKGEQAKVFDAIEGIKGLDDAGNPILGTDLRAGSGEVRKTAEQAKKDWDALSPEGQRAAKWYAVQRDTDKAILGIASDVEGYIHHFKDDSILSLGKQVFLKKKKAAAQKARGAVEGLEFVKDAERAILKGRGESESANIYNEMLDEIKTKVSRPMPQSGTIPEGWVEVPALQATRAGKPIGQIAGKRIMPAGMYDEWVRMSEPIKDIGEVQKMVGNLGRYFKANILTAPGTVATNAISGGLQYAGKIMEDMFRAAWTRDTTPLKNSLWALGDALRPSTIKARPATLWGKQSALASDLGKPNSPLMKAYDVLLTPFEAVENYFKRALVQSRLGEKGLSRIPAQAITKDADLIGDLNRVVDRYAFNYENVPNFIKKARESWWGWAVVPFPTYAYKLGRYYSRYGAALNPFIKMAPEDRFARLMTLATMGGAGVAASSGNERKHIKGMTSQVDVTGRTKIGTTDEGKERWLRTVKYPWFNLGQGATLASEMAETGSDDGMTDYMGEFMSPGPLVEALKIAAGYGNRWEAYIPKGVRAGGVVSSFIPGTRLTQGIKAQGGGPRVLPTSFYESVSNALPFTGMKGKIQVDRVTKKPVMLDPNLEAWKFWVGLSMKEIDPERYDKERQGKLKAALAAIGDAKDESQLSSAVERLSIIDPSKLRHLSEAIKAKRIELRGEEAQLLETIMAKEASGMSKVRESITGGGAR